MPNPRFQITGRYTFVKLRAKEETRHSNEAASNDFRTEMTLGSNFWSRVKSFRYFALLLCCSTALSVPVQSLQLGVENEREKNESHASEKVEATDAFGRNTPNGTVFGFLEAARNGRYDEASEYLQISKDVRATNGTHIARQLYALMESAFVERVGVISGNAEGSHQIGIPRDRQRIGVFRINGTDTNVDLVHVSDPTYGPIWLFSSQVVAEIPDLSAQIENSETGVGRSHLQVVRRSLNTFPRRLLVLLLLVPASLALGWFTARVLRGLVRLVPRWRHNTFLKGMLESLTVPGTVILAVIVHQVGVYLLGIPIVTRLHYQKMTGTLVVLGVAWFVFRLINVWSDHARARTLASSDYRGGSIILLGQRISKVIVVIVAGLVTLSILGVDITTALAGLGIGSIALAFAAQKTLENLLGGVSILVDEVVRIGELCRIGDREGTVEDISLRSTRIRTLEGTVLSVPNGQLANMNLENISRRDQYLFRTRFGLRQEISSERLQSLLGEITAILRQHPKVNLGALKVHLVGFGEASFEIEVNCYILTGRFEEFRAIREALLLRIMDLIPESGAAFAVPARLLYMTETMRNQAVQESQSLASRRYGGS